MKKLRLNFLFLLFFIPLFSLSNFYIVSANDLKSSPYNFYEMSRICSDEKNLSKALEDLALKGFETERLKIDKMKKEDYDILSSYLMDNEVTKYLVVGSTLRFFDVKNAKRYIEFLDRVHTATFILRLKDTKKPIGMLGFSFDNTFKGQIVNISYWLGKEYQGKGYAKEAIPMIVNEAFKNIGTLKFYIDFRTENIASKKLADSIIEYISKNNSESSKLAVEKFNCFRLDIEEYLISKKSKENVAEKISA